MAGDVAATQARQRQQPRTCFGGPDGDGDGGGGPAATLQLSAEAAKAVWAAARMAAARSAYCSDEPAGVPLPPRGLGGGEALARRRVTAAIQDCEST